MRAGQPVLGAIVTMDVELAKAIHTLEFLETVERDFAGTSDKLEQLCTLFLIEGSDSSPEPLDLW